MSTALDDNALIKDDDLITVSDGRKSVRYYDAGDVSFLNSLDKFILCLGIKSTGRFIKNDD